MSQDELLRDATARALEYLRTVDERPVAPAVDAVTRLAELGGPPPEHPEADADILALLDEVGSPATVASAGPRYFGFVVGGSLPVTTATSILAGAWDQNAFVQVASPTGTALERITLEWLVDILGLPSTTYGALVTGTALGNVLGLAAARTALLADAGWDIEADGLVGAPQLRVVAGAEAHATLVGAVALLGLGRARIESVPVDGQGRMRPEALPPLDDRTILCVQAGNVNTGALDPAEPLCAAAHEAGAWVHVDGAFGLWARATPRLAETARGYDAADSWATDAHKWLNVPYDCGAILVRDPIHLSRAMAVSAAYLPEAATGNPFDYTPEGSRRARGVGAWAAIRSLGRSGIADLVDRCCTLARQFGDGLSAGGCEILNEVGLNQVLVAFGDDVTTNAVIAGVQKDGTCWCGGTVWQGRAAMRISVSSWATTPADVDQSVAAILRVAKAQSLGGGM
jgi:glutamate/tyrosine decarboxylase-like PLP-dependent enzyme